MNHPPAPNRNPRAGGLPIALATVVGTIIGMIRNQPTIGLLAGFALGCAAAIAIWWVDRRR